MIIALALISLFRYFKQANALPIPDPADGTLPPVGDASDPSRQREALDIFWSCFATTLSCTWSAVHPNMSFYGNDSLRDRTGRKLYLMLLALFFPEFVLAWSYAQYSSARKTQRAISQLYEDKNANHHDCQWTIVHSHFLQMGGFRLRCSEDGWKEFQELLLFHYQLEAPANQALGPAIQLPAIDEESASHTLDDQLSGDQRLGAPLPVAQNPGDQQSGSDWIGALTAQAFIHLLKEDRIKFPHIPEEALKDRDKKDAFLRFFTIVQLVWFIVQIIARAANHLEMAPIEITTFALVICSIFMYCFWWSKPFDATTAETLVLSLRGANLDFDPVPATNSEHNSGDVIDDRVGTSGGSYSHTNGSTDEASRNSGNERVSYHPLDTCCDPHSTHSESVGQDNDVPHPGEATPLAGDHDQEADRLSNSPTDIRPCTRPDIVTELWTPISEACASVWSSFRESPKSISSLYARCYARCIPKLQVAQMIFNEFSPRDRAMIIATAPLTISAVVVLGIPVAISGMVMGSLVSVYCVICVWPFMAITPDMDSYARNLKRQYQVGTKNIARTFILFLAKTLDGHHVKTRIITMFYVEPHKEVHATSISLGVLFVCISTGIHLGFGGSDLEFASLFAGSPFIVFCFACLYRSVANLIHPKKRFRMVEFPIFIDPLYFLTGRFFIIIISVTSLQSLSSSALEAVPWIEKLPHI